MNYFKDVKNNPKLDKDYFCSKCGNFHDPFAHNTEEMTKLFKFNICDKCSKTFDARKLWGHEKSQPQDINSKA